MSIDPKVIQKVIVDGEKLTIEDVIAVGRFGACVEVPIENMKKVTANWKVLQEMLDEGQTLYGVNTGIGGAGNIRISREKGAELSKRMIRAHASGVGKPADLEIARAAILLRLNVLVKGYSGIRPGLVTQFAELLNRNVTPVIYEKGSVGTSGDLAPLAQMALVLIGEGEAFYEGERLPAAEALRRVGLEPYQMGCREGLAAFNGSQFMTAYAAFNIFDGNNLVKTSEVAGALSIDVLNSVTLAFDKRLHDLRPFAGQIKSAANLRKLMEGSAILQQPKKDTQSAYSLRCTPQVTGPAKDALDYTRKQVEIEMNSVADNPIFSTDDKAYLAGGNFHGEPIALVMDMLSAIITDLGNLSERRTNRLLNPNLRSDLPPFLVKEAGLDSGLMIAQYTQAALVSENKILASPAIVDSIPVSGDQEDHVSMGTIGARHCREIIQNTQKVVAIELLCGCQALDFRRPLRAGKGGEAAYAMVRKVSPFIAEDRIFLYDIEKAVALIETNVLLDAVEKEVGRLE
jgi:histidine ammonia-lyase